jgi:hypothetical protein
MKFARRCARPVEMYARRTRSRSGRLAIHLDRRTHSKCRRSCSRSTAGKPAHGAPDGNFMEASIAVIAPSDDHHV